ncbi:MAG: HepT-like ribonuclease domain-containing protein [Phycisphaerae bacterium]
MRRDDLFLADIVAAADAIAGFIAGRNEAEFVSNDLLRSAVLQKLTVIGEAAARVSQRLRDRHTEIPWRDIVAFRNIAVHRYFGIDWQVVWNAATHDVPGLREDTLRIIAALGDGGAQ